MKLPKKPAACKLPKKPKASAPASSWIRYDERVKAAQKKHAAKVSEYNKKVQVIKSAAAKKQQLIKKYS